MAKKVVTDRGVCIRVVCKAFRISESCYRYERKLDAENVEVANWLIRLTDNHRNWGFGLYYLYLRNVKGFKWNHKHVYRIYKESWSSIYGSSLANALCARSQKS
jgi:putative transposase